MIHKIINKLLGDKNAKIIKKLQPIVEEVNKIEERYQTEIKSDEDVVKKTEEFRARHSQGESLDDLLPEAFALVKHTCRRLMGQKWMVRTNETTWDMIPYDVQILGGIALHQGNIAEMKTGEGKTLVCTMPLYLHSLSRKGSYLVTVNEYLAQRDAEWMGGVYKYLGLTVGVVKHAQSTEDKKQAYASDITYGTNNEFGFDYLRDNMVTDAEEIVQKTLNFCIVDEVDSILIDEARTPLIISAPAEESTAKYQTYSRLVQQLKEKDHYEIDEKMKTASLTEVGIKKMEELLGVENIYTEKGFAEVHHLEQALRATACYKRDIDYLIKDNEILIIDEFTGRLMPGRRYSHGLHQAIEAKENVEVKRESKTLATITFQNYFRMFNRLSGMTGTAKTEEEEFYQIYGLEVIMIPPNKVLRRTDRNDTIYKSQTGKFMAAAEKIKELHDKGQPVLVGTISVEKSEVMSKLLTKLGVKHSVLNAKNHEKEAEIIKDAGQKSAVTIATNMAGRGTDIKLGEGVTEVGGLFVMGTERHESRRIDNQLRGRSGRQGDPGESQFFVSMEDDLMRLFGGDKIKKMMELMRVPEDMPIENRMLSGSIESSQKKVEGHHFDIRKHVLQYDDVMNIHRDIIYTRRRKFLESENLKEEILAMIKEEVEAVVLNHTASRSFREWDLEKLITLLHAISGNPAHPISKQEIEIIRDENSLAEFAKKWLVEEYEEIEKNLPDTAMLRKVEKSIFLRSNDVLWMEHIDEMQGLRETVSMRGYGQRDPLTEYKSEGFRKFEEMVSMIRSNTVNTLFKVDFEKIILRELARNPEMENIRTNEDEVESTLTGSHAKRGEPLEPSPSTNPVMMRPVTHSTHPTIIKATDDDYKKPSGNPTIIRVSANDKDETHPQSPITAEKVGRNEPCPCGSGKKYKKCCGGAV